MSDPTRWTTVAGIVAAVRRRWDDGTLLRAYALGERFPTLTVPLRGPSAADLGVHFDESRAWAHAIVRGSRDGQAYQTVRGRIGGRLAGATELPVRAVVESYSQAWQLLGTAAQAEAFLHAVDLAAEVPTIREWALAHPLRAVAQAENWSSLLIAYEWLAKHRGSGLYLRQVSAPGVDTKFFERHRGVLAEMLGVRSGAAFASVLGFAVKPPVVRVRFDPDLLQMPPSITEATFRTEELGSLHVRPRTALIIENEITYLSVPIPADSVVLWGKGYDAEEPASLAWLAHTDVRYWGDIDTHGFGILNNVRARLPHTRSVLMDRETLLVHEDRWGDEPVPANSALSNLSTAERALYEDLVTDRYGSAVRLEQERIDWEWALERLGGF